MSNVSKLVADKLVASRAVRTAGEVHSKAIAEGVERWLFDGEKPRKLSVGELCELLVERLGAHERGLELAERAHQAELGDDAAPRERREAASVALRAALISTSELVRGAYGEGYSKLVGLEAPLADRDDLLVQQARSSAERLRSTAPTGKPRDGAAIDRNALGKALQNDGAILDAALESVQREEKEAQQTRIVRDQAEAGWARSYDVVGGVLELFARAAGQDEIADRVRPTARRRSGVPDDGGQPGGGDAPAGGEPTGGGAPVV